MQEEEFAELRQRVMATAEAYRYHADVELVDFLASDVQLGGNPPQAGSRQALGKRRAVDARVERPARAS